MSPTLSPVCEVLGTEAFPAILILTISKPSTEKAGDCLAPTPATDTVTIHLSPERGHLPPLLMGLAPLSQGLHGPRKPHWETLPLSLATSCLSQVGVKRGAQGSRGVSNPPPCSPSSALQGDQEVGRPASASGGSLHEV